MNRRWRIVSAALLLMLALGLAELTWQYPGAFNNTAPLGSLRAEAFEVTPVAAHPDGRPGRVVVFVVDGLRKDVSNELPFLGELGARGAALSLKAPLPSMSRPSYASMASGTTPERTGLRSNRYDQPVVVDTIFARAHEAHRRVIGVADLNYWPQNHGGSFDAFEVVEAGASEALDAAVRGALREDADLVLIHLVDVDRAGHAHGVGPEYREAAQALDVRLRAWSSGIDLTRDAVIVLADHGHLDEGGHGGDERRVLEVPFVLAGRGIRTPSGVRHPPTGPPDTETVATLAPTLAVLLDLPYPRDLSAAPTFQALDPAVLGATALEARKAEWEDHRTRYERAWVAHVRDDWSQGGRFDNPVVEATHVEPDAELYRLMETRDRTLDAMAEHRLLGRTPLIAIVMAVIVVLGLVGLLRGNRALPLLAIPVFGLAVMAAQHLAGHPFTLSAIASAPRFWGLVGVAAVVCFGLYLVALEGLLRAAKTRRRAEARHVHLGLAALCNGGVAVTLWVLSGFWLDAPLPGPTMTYLPYLCGANAAAFAALAGLALLATPRRPVASAPLPSAEIQA